MPLRRAELTLLAAFLYLRALLFWRYADVGIGYDISGHLEAMSLVSWSSPFPPLRAGYYAHHPPLGFLLANTVTLLGVTPFMGAKIVSFLAALGAFLFMRRALTVTGALSTIAGIAFLYVGASLPMHLYLSAGISLDVLVLCCMSVALWLSVRLLWVARSELSALASVVSLVVVLVVAVLCKISGLVLLAVPPVVALSSPRRSAEQLVEALLISAIAGAACFTFFYMRYYLAEGTLLFNSAGTFAWVGLVAESRALRDDHLVLFLLRFVLPLGEMPRLLPAWHALWMVVAHPFPSISVGIVRLALSLAMMALSLTGIVAFLREACTPVSDWLRFGWILLALLALHVAALCYYMYSLPLPGYFSNKGIYIASASWAVAYLAVAAVSALGAALWPFPKTRHIACALAIAAFMVWQHLMPL